MRVFEKKHRISFICNESINPTSRRYKVAQLRPLQINITIFIIIPTSILRRGHRTRSIFHELLNSAGENVYIIRNRYRVQNINRYAYTHT